MLESLKKFKLDVWMASNKGPSPPRSFAPRLGKILSQMPDLDKLSLVIPEYHTDIFAVEFKAQNLSLPSVKTVALGSFCEFALQHCPNVETVSSSGYRFSHSIRGDLWPRKVHASQLIVAAGKMKHLKYFEMHQALEGRAN
jgi:hypothetical protein